jgi:hypothetical protein
MRFTQIFNLPPVHDQILVPEPGTGQLTRIASPLTCVNPAVASGPLLIAQAPLPISPRHKDWDEVPQSGKIRSIGVFYQVSHVV